MSLTAFLPVGGWTSATPYAPGPRCRACPTRAALVGPGMRTPSRVLLAVTAALAAAQPAAATPSAHVRTASERSFEMQSSYAYDSVSLRFRHLRGSLGAGTHSGGASGESWEACLYAWGSPTSFYGCGTP